VTPDSELDAGLDANLETYPRHQVALLAATPWIMVPPGQGLAMYVLVSIPILWIMRSLRARSAR
jgi:hypothetical protein